MLRMEPVRIMNNPKDFKSPIWLVQDGDQIKYFDVYQPYAFKCLVDKFIFDLEKNLRIKNETALELAKSYLFEQCGGVRKDQNDAKDLIKKIYEIFNDKANNLPSQNNK